MAKKSSNNSEETNTEEKDVKTLAKQLRNTLNKSSDDDKISWDLTDNDSPTHIKSWISTGSTILDYIISNRRNGGIPCGKITELQGEESSGKSLLCAHIIANTQKMGGIAVYLDTENALNPDFAERIGVDLEKLIYVQPETIEQSFEVIDNVIKTLRAKAPNQAVTIIWDSVGNTPPQAEIEGSFDANARMGLGAKAMAIGMRKITGMIGREQITMVFTQPLTYKMSASPYVDPLDTKYGKALPYHSSIRLRVQSSTKLKDKNGEIYGLVTNGRIIKSRLGTSHRTCKFEIHFDHGIDDETSWFMVLHEAGLISKEGGWCYIESLPSGRIWPTGVNAGKDRGVQFREADFGNLCREDQKVRNWALDALEKLLVVKYENKRPQREGQEVPNDEAQDVIDVAKQKKAELLND